MAVAPEAYTRAPDNLEARYAPVLTDLVTAGLLERDDRGRWALTGTAHRWLDARANRPLPPVEARVAVGLRCQACGESGLTTMTDGRRLCSRCKVIDGYVDADPVPQLRARRTP
ncbi:MAG TPA: hypothetical protein VED63_07905 [Acidimicrobiales bacterium]|nr:hypothetical protein [Acidimicrobiales bacterium]